MKASLINKYGSPEVFEYKECPVPEINEEEILIKVYAASINPIDWKIRNGSMKFFLFGKFPKILGVDISGKIEKTGNKVNSFTIGDNVYAMLSSKGGAYAEYVNVNQNLVSFKPTNMTFEAASTVPCVALTALQALRDIGKIKNGFHVLVNGASGGVGIFGVQLAKAYGARVTAVCSEKNFEFVKSLGADELIDYKIIDFTKTKNKYNIILDCVASRTYKECKKVLVKDGIYITTLPGLSNIFYFLFTKLTKRKAYFVLARPNKRNLEFLKEMIQKGDLKTHIDKTFQLSEMADAHRYSETGRVRGKISIQICSMR